MRGSIETRVAALVQEELAAFTEWLGNEWKLTRELAASDPELRDMPQGYLDGYNAALKSAGLALESYIEDQKLGRRTVLRSGRYGEEVKGDDTRPSHLSTKSKARSLSSCR